MVSPRSYFYFFPEHPRAQEFGIGGAEVQLAKLAQAWAQDPRVSVSMLVGDFGQPEREEVDGVTLVRSVKLRAGILGQALSLVRALIGARPGIVIQRTMHPGSALSALICRCLRARFIYMVAHDGETDGSAIVYRSAAVRRAADVVFRLAHAVVVQNDYQSEKIRSRYPRAAVVTHKKGVDSAAPGAGEPEYDAAWIGRFEPWKRPDMFVALARENPALRLLMVCAPVDGPREAFDRFMHEAAAPDNLKFIPGLPHDRISETLQSARAFCFTSEQEGDWPMVVLEAAACGLPVICAGAQYGGLVDAYGGGVACDSVAAMAAELQALKSDPDRCERMADGAMRYIREHHDMSGQAARLLDRVLEI